MTQAQHTKGVWTCKPSNISDNLYEVYDQNGNFLTINDKVHEANAALIAAAPELLEALSNALPAIKACADEYPLGEWPSMYEHALSALKKAGVK